MAINFVSVSVRLFPFWRWHWVQPVRLLALLTQIRSLSHPCILEQTISFSNFNLGNQIFWKKGILGAIKNRDYRMTFNCMHNIKPKIIWKTIWNNSRQKLYVKWSTHFYNMKYQDKKVNNAESFFLIQSTHANSFAWVRMLAWNVMNQNTPHTTGKDTQSPLAACAAARGLWGSLTTGMFSNLFGID